MIASRILLTAGTNLGSAPPGKYYIMVREDGEVIKVDDAANEQILGAGGDSTSIVTTLDNLTDVDATGEIGQVMSIGPDGKFVFTAPTGEKGDPGPMPSHRQVGTQLQFELPDGSWGTLIDLKGEKGDKGDKGDVGDIGPSGPVPDHEQVNTAIRFRTPEGIWGALVDLKGDKGDPGQDATGGTGTGGAGFDGLFYASNQLWQSHHNLSTINVVQDNVIRNVGGLFSHSTTNNPEEIVCNFNGQVEVAVKVVMISSDKDPDIVGNAYLTKNQDWYNDLQTYDYLKERNKGNRMAMVIPSGQVQVSEGDVLRVHTMISIDKSMGDLRDVATSYGESTVTLKAYVD